MIAHASELATRKSVNAILAGLLVGGGLSLVASALLWVARPDAFSTAGRVESTPILAFATGYAFVFGVAGFYLTARLAPRQPLRHVLFLALLGLILCALGIVFWDMAPPWYHWINLAQVLPAAWLGAWWRAEQLRRTRRRP